MFGSIDKSLKPLNPIVYLCKPNKERIAILKEAFNKQHSIKYNDIHEFTFTLPYTVKKNNKSVHNDHVDLIRGRYLLEVDGEFYIIDSYEKQAVGKKKILSVHSYYLPYELADKDVRGYKGVKNLTQAMTDTLLADTEYTLAYVDASFDTKYREFNVSEQTLLQFIWDTAKKFSAVVLFNSKNRTVSFYKQENLGNDKGFYINHKKYLKEIMDKVNFDNVCTRLKLYGKNGDSINGVSPTGQNYIENFTAFMYPYQEDSQGNVLSHSNYMSDGLCHAILQYNTFLTTKEGEFETLLNQLSSAQQVLTTKSDELDVLNNDLKILQAQLGVANSTGQPTAIIIANISAKQSAISAKQVEVNTAQSNVNNINSQITALKNTLTITNHFTPEQLIERNRFIIVRSFNNDSYYDAKELYNVGKTELAKLIYPPVDIQVNIVNFLQVVKCQRDWNKLSIGDLIRLDYPDFGISIQAKVFGININYENHSIDIEIADYKRLKSDEDYLQEMLYKNISTSTTVDMNKMWWDTAQQNQSEVQQLLNNIWDANAREIRAGYEQSVEIGRRGLVIKDSNDPLNYLVGMNSILAITNDGGNSWKNAITKNGIVAERLYGQVIAGTDLTITTSDGSFIVNELGVSITDLDLELLRQDEKSKIILDTLNGFKIQNNTGTAWEDIFYIGVNGYGYFKGDLDIVGSLKINGQEALTEGGKIKALSIENLEVGSNVTMGANATITWSQVNKTGASASDIGALPSNTFIPGETYITTLTETTISTTEITAQKLKVNAANIVGELVAGSIKTDGSISVVTDVTIGNVLNMGVNPIDPRKINFGNGCYIDSFIGSSTEYNLRLNANYNVDVIAGDSIIFTVGSYGALYLPTETYIDSVSSNNKIATIENLSNVKAKFA